MVLLLPPRMLFPDTVGCKQFTADYQLIFQQIPGT